MQTEMIIWMAVVTLGIMTIAVNTTRKKTINDWMMIMITITPTVISFIVIVIR